MNSRLSFLAISFLLPALQGMSQGTNDAGVDNQSGVVRKHKKDTRRIRLDKEEDFIDPDPGHIYTGYVVGFPTIRVKGQSSDFNNLAFHHATTQGAVLGFQCTPEGASHNLFARIETSFSFGQYTGSAISLQYPYPGTITRYSLRQYTGVLGLELYYSVPNLPLRSRIYLGGGIGLTVLGYSGNTLTIRPPSMKAVVYSDYIDFGDYLESITYNLRLGMLFNRRIGIEVRKTFPFTLSEPKSDQGISLSMSSFGICLLYHFNTPPW